MTAHHHGLILSIVLVASQLAGCGASIATPENAECRCGETTAQTQSATAPTPPTAAATPSATTAGQPTPAPIAQQSSARATQPALVSTRATTTRRAPFASNPALGVSGEPVRVRGMMLARGVSNRAPVDPGDHFVVGGPDERLYTWVEVENESDQSAELVFTWIPPQGTARGGQVLAVPAGTPRWRTWAFTRQARTPGQWTAEVRTSDGELLARQTFTIEAPATPAQVVPRS